jgi:outer membrane protein assembly factor BamB
MRKGTAALPGFLLLCWCITPQGESSAADWPRFRGPEGAGVAADKDIPVKWSAKDGVLWKVELPGAGNSSPVIWGKKLFVQSATGDERLLLCLDVADGKTLWKKSFLGARASKHQKNSFASSTPATDGERVYALIWDGKKIILYAHDLKGKFVWKHDLGGPFKGRHGVGASPIVYQGKVFLNNDQTGQAELIALDARTGETAWRKKRTPFRCCYSTPFILGSGKKVELIVSSTAGITSYDPKDGAENWNWTWEFDGMALRTVGSPIAGQGMIFAGSGDGSGARHMVAIKASGKGDVTKTNLVWEKKRDTPYVPGMLIKGDYLYWVNDKGIAACCHAKDGKEVWSERVVQGAVTASPLLINGKIYVVSERGDVVVFAAAPTYKRLAKNPLAERVMATPAVADHRLFIRGDEHLFCIGKAAGK